MIVSLAHNSQLGLFSEDEEFLKPALQALKIEADLIYAVVYDDKGRAVAVESAYSSNKIPDYEKDNSIPYKVPYISERGNEPFFRINQLMGQDIYEFWAPVLTSTGMENEFIYLEDEASQGKLRKQREKVIGYVRAGISLEGLNNVIRDVVISSVTILFFFLLFGFIITFFLARMITEPIGQLARALMAVEEGDLTRRLDMERSDEVGTLINSFNRMTGALMERDEEIRLHHEEIEFNNRELLEKTERLDNQRRKLDASLKEKEVLLREIHHRVKNNMQVISSLLRLQSGYINDDKYKEMLKESQDRIRSMALVHEKLYRSHDLSSIEFSKYIKNLANSLFRSYSMATHKVVLDIDARDYLLGIDSAIPCGLILNELISNSLKYAFPDSRSGKIKISLNKLSKNDVPHLKNRKDADDSPDEALEVLELIVADDGIGLPEDLNIKKCDSLGLQLVSTLVEDQLHGNIEITRDNGTKFRICFREIVYRERI